MREERSARVAGAIRAAGGPLSTTSAALFAGLSGLRRKRVFHPKGDAYSGRVTTTATSFDLPFQREHDVLVRFSRGAGLPEPLPDLYGIAIKFRDLNQDLLLATSGSGPVTRHGLIPTTGAFRLPFSSVLPYEASGDLVVFGARADERHRSLTSQRLNDLAAIVSQHELLFDLTVARVGSDSAETFATLVVESPYEGELSFNPWNTHSKLRPAGGLNALRRRSYESSQAARP